jgi:hypothetical protein
MVGLSNGSASSLLSPSSVGFTINIAGRSFRQGQLGAHALAYRRREQSFGNGQNLSKTFEVPGTAGTILSLTSTATCWSACTRRSTRTPDAGLRCPGHRPPKEHHSIHNRALPSRTRGATWCARPMADGYRKPSGRRQSGQRLYQLESHRNSPRSIIFVNRRPAKIGHDTIALKLSDVAALLTNLLRRDLVIVIHDLRQLFRIQLVGKSC